MYATRASRLLSSAKNFNQVTRNNSANVISGPPTVKVSFGEKLVHGVLLAVGVMAVPSYVLVNLKKYRGQE